MSIKKEGKKNEQDSKASTTGLTSKDVTRYNESVIMKA